jgi:chemotaxis family two-component system sensor kinase Cph1
MVVLWGPELVQIYNEAYCGLMGSKHPAGLGQPTQECWPEVWHFNEPIYARVRVGEAVTLEDQLFPIARYGYVEHAYFSLCYSPVHDESGRVGGVLVTVFETTKRIKAESERERAEAALRASEEERYRALVRASSEVLYRMSPDWSEMRQLGGSGFIADTESPRWDWLPEYIPPEDEQMVLDAIRHAIRTKSLFELEHRVRLASGGVGWTCSRAAPILDDRGEISEWIGAASDITARKAAEEEIRRQNQQLMTSNRELEEFAYVASHDLQEPLRMVGIFTQLLLARIENNDPEARHHGEVIRNAVSRMRALIQDLLTFSSTVHSEAPLAGVADLSEALARATSVLRGAIDETNALITAPVLPCVRGDTAQMAQVFQNLLSNALKYRLEGTKPEVQISVTRTGPHWVISVRDRGIGFEPRYGERIFGLFKRLHKETYPGTGLGLAICRRIVERHGGRIWAEATPGEGATFYMSLPLAEGS